MELCDKQVCHTGQERDQRLAYLQKAFDAVAATLGITVLAQPAVVLSPSSCTDIPQPHL